MTYVSNILKYVQNVNRYRGSSRHGYDSSSDSDTSGTRWNHDPSHIEEFFAKRARSRGLDDGASLARALALFALFVPIFQVCWLSSRGGKRRITNHVTIFVLALAGGLCELLSSLMMTGTRSMAAFLCKRFEMNNWELSGNDDGSGSGTGIGWRVLEISYMMNRGLTVWVNAFEWICLSAIFTILFIDVITEKGFLKEDANSLSRKWAVLGFVIGMLGLAEFISDILRTFNWRFYSLISESITILNLWLLLPVWLIMLGMKLPHMKDMFEDQVEDPENLVEENALITANTAVMN